MSITPSPQSVFLMKQFLLYKFLPFTLEKHERRDSSLWWNIALTRLQLDQLIFMEFQQDSEDRKLSVLMGDGLAPNRAIEQRASAVLGINYANVAWIWSSLFAERKDHETRSDERKFFDRIFWHWIWIFFSFFFPSFPFSMRKEQVWAFIGG